MALMISTLYDALREGGASDENARKAAEEVAGYDNRLHNVESKLTLLTWMVGANIALSLGILLRLLP